MDDHTRAPARRSTAPSAAHSGGSGRRARRDAVAPSGPKASRRRPPRRVTSMRDSRPAFQATLQFLLVTRRGNRTRDRENLNLLLYPTELACCDHCPAASRYTHPRLLPGESAPAGFRNRTAAKFRDKDLLTARRPSIERWASHRIRKVCMAPKRRGPDQRRLTGASYESLAESCRTPLSDSTKS